MSRVECLCHPMLVICTANGAGDFEGPSASFLVRGPTKSTPVRAPGVPAWMPLYFPKFCSFCPKNPNPPAYPAILSNRVFSLPYFCVFSRLFAAIRSSNAFCGVSTRPRANFGHTRRLFQGFSGYVEYPPFGPRGS